MPAFNAAEVNAFKRIESKFFIAREKSNDLLMLVEERMTPSYPDSETRYNEIESLYFDSPQLDIFASHYLTLDKRFKIRTRTYGPNGIWKRDKVFLEMKVKKLEVTEKFRIRIDSESQRLLLTQSKSGLPLSRELHRANSSLEMRELSRQVKEMDYHFRKLSLRPFSRLTYRRRAYENGPLRVTFDENIRTETLAEISAAVRNEMMSSSFWPSAEKIMTDFSIADSIILEVKHQGIIPSWLLSFLKESSIPEARFSKYCYSVISHLLASTLESKAPAWTQTIAPRMRSMIE